MIGEVDERTFEMHLMKELRAKPLLYFPLGQLGENFLGFDPPAMTRNYRLWRVVGHSFRFDVPYVGEQLREVAIELETVLNEQMSTRAPLSRHVLLQYVRPERIESRQGKEWAVWRAPYYRYDIDETRQALLLHIAQALGDDGLVVYAAPAVHTSKALLEANMAGTVERSANFKTVQDLRRRTRVTYTRASDRAAVYGGRGRYIDNATLTDMVRDVPEAPAQQAGGAPKLGRETGNRKFIAKMAAAATGAFEAEEPDVRRPFEMMTGLIEDLRNYELLHSLLVMSIFRQLTGTQWAMAEKDG